ncbi:MAG: GGDEF domain-containing protein [Chitinispirillia bacterium]|nr:GGDEF domain-containing protein [Chitinispirillia bacterium]MCL2242782.1 GGDEF domain-containing protein [Chitinispirillia bacterium]
MATVEELRRELEELRREFDLEQKNAFLLVRDATDFYKELLKTLELDSLTGLPGSNKYHEFKKEIEKHAVTVGAIAFDVNDLKYYNDNRGHQAGDHLLQKAAKSFHAIADRRAQIFRTGGDEFVGILVNCAEAEIAAIIARWQKKLAELNDAADGITCNIAWGAAFGAEGYKFDEILALADERMYAEKKRMKGCGLKIGEVR